MGAEMVRRELFRKEWGLRSVLWVTVACGLLLASEAAAQYAVYRYVDDRGVVHFSDVRHDARYQRVVRTERGLTTRVQLDHNPPIHDGYDHLIRRVASAYALEPSLVKAVIAAESLFDPTAVSRAGAQGLMQLMPATARELGVKNPFRPEENVLGGARYLRSMLNRYGDLQRTLAAYNAGPEAVDRYRGIPPYRETQAYVARVMNYYRGYHADFE